MRFIDRNIEWIVAIAVLQLSILLFDNFCRWLFPSIGVIFTLLNYIVLLLMMSYQLHHYGWKNKSQLFLLFFFIYSIYVLVDMTVYRVYPLHELLGVPIGLPGFFILTTQIFGYLLCSETICRKFSFRKFFYLGVLFTLIPALIFVNIVGIHYFQFAEWTEENSALQVTSLTYSNVPLFVMALLCYDDLSENKTTSHIVSIAVLFAVGFVLLMSSRRGPLLWCIVNILICYFYKSRKSLSYVLFVSLLGLVIYYNIETVLGWISALFPTTGERIYGSIFEGATSGRYDADDQERSTYFLGFNQFLQSPIYGSYFRIITPDMKFRGVYPHNIFIEMLMTMGMLGFIPLCAFLKKIFINNRYSFILDKNKLVLFSLFLSSFLQLQTADTIVVNVWFWVLFGVVLTISKQNSHSRQLKF